MTKPRQTGQIKLGARLVLLLGANLAITAGSSLSPVIPEMGEDFSGVPGAAFWVPLVFTLPALFVVLGGPVVGFLTDRLGRKPVLVIRWTGWEFGCGFRILGRDSFYSRPGRSKHCRYHNSHQFSYRRLFRW